MRSGATLLALAVTALWALVYLGTQTLTDPPLSAGWTIGVGVGLTVVLIVGYPSALRGPRYPASAGRRQRRDPGHLALVGRSIPLRGGLTSEAAARTVELLQPLVGGDAVAIAGRDRILAFTGVGSDHHHADEPVRTAATARVLETAKVQRVRRHAEVGCDHPGCPLRCGIIAPLFNGQRTVGALKVYRTGDELPSQGVVEGLAGVLSLHLELAELDYERQLAADAKLNALRAQINPHFLYNTLNTIASKARTDPEDARRLLLRLSDFFRYATRQHGQFAEFGEEYFYVRTYLALEQARFGDRLTVRYDVDPQVLGVQVPVLTIQPLMENAVKHGFAPDMGSGSVQLRARVDPLARSTAIQVRDDGVGMDPERLEAVRRGEVGEAAGVGLRNITDRLTSLFGDRYALDIASVEGKGTTVDLRVPLR